jgi:CubicO group peptidase (beta-lactamase class C family)
MDKKIIDPDAILKESVTGRGYPPGAVIWIGLKGKTFFQSSYGFSQVVPKPEKMRFHTIFDLASLTKPLATAMAIMALRQEKALKLTDPISKYLPDFSGRPNGTVSLEELLTHTAGLPSWYPLYLLDRNHRTAYLGRARVRNKTVNYSCLDYIILGEIIAAVTGMPLDRFCQSRIFKKAGLSSTSFCPGARHDIAATEFGNEHEKQKVSRRYRGKKAKGSVKWRNYMLRGEAHDGNCYYAFQGVSGNAGLFSNANDLAKFLSAYVSGGIVSMQAVADMTRARSGRFGPERFGLGWKVGMYPGALSARSFGHTGFTGTMICVDPARGLVVVLLTNSVHPKVRLGIMPKLRRRIIESVVRAV